MNTTAYKFMCDNCGASAAKAGFCANCGQALTMYARDVRRPHPVRYIR